MMGAHSRRMAFTSLSLGSALFYLPDFVDLVSGPLLANWLSRKR